MTTQETITKMQAFTERNNLPLAGITVSMGDRIKFLFENPLTAAQLTRIKNELFFVDSTVDIELEPSAFNMHECVLTVAGRTHNVFCGVLSELRQIPGMYIEKVSVKDGEIHFYFRMQSRPSPNIQELEKIQLQVDPTIPNHDSLRVFGYKGEYTLSIRFE